MKILQVCPDYPPYVRGGGAETYRLLSDAWTAQGHTVSVVSSFPSYLGGMAADSPPGGEPVFFELYNPPFRLTEITYFLPLKVREFFRLMRTLKRYAASNDMIVIHGTMETLPLLALFLLRRYAGKTIVVDHAVSTAGYRPLLRMLSNVSYRSIGKLALSGIRNVLVFCERTRLEFIDYFGSGSGFNIAEIPLGIDVDEFRRQYSLAVEHESSLGAWLGTWLPSGSSFVLAIGRNVRTKGLDVLIESFSKVAEEFRDLRLVVAGDATGYTEELRQLASSLNLAGRVHFIGRVTEEEKILMMLRCSCLVIPSLKEGYGLNAVEAAILRLPVVATKTGAHEQILSRSGTSLFVEPGDASGLADCIAEVMRGRGLPRSFSREEADRFDMKVLSRQYLEAFPLDG